jgi:hypothetical protein
MPSFAQDCKGHGVVRDELAAYTGAYTMLVVGDQRRNSFASSKSGELSGYH